jgi:hypothetical protein
MEIKRVWTKDEIKALLEKSDEMVRRSLIKIYECQTELEKQMATAHEDNGIGFNKYDAEILTSIAEQCKKHGRLSEKQIALARKRLPKYAGQLARLANIA